MTSKKTQKDATTSGWVDSASVTHVVQAYDVWPKKSFPCGWTVPRLVTSLLISPNNIGLAPGVSENKILSKGPIGDVTKGLLKSGVISRPATNDSMIKKALCQSQEQANIHCSYLRRKFSELRQSNETQLWMDWSIRSAWEEHAQNFGGLIDTEFISQLARILETTEKDLRKLQLQTSKPATVKELVKLQPDTDLFNMIYNCFLLGLLLRGFYHDFIAKRRAEHIAHHPLRMAFLQPTQGEPLVFDQTSTENYLTNIVLHDALCEKTLKGRLERWVNNIKRIQEANIPHHEKIDLREKDEPELALEKAVEAAKTVNIYVHSNELEEFLAGTAKATIDIVSYLLTPFVGYSNTGLEYFGVKTDELIRKGVRAYCGRRSRLSKLGESPPGRISTYKQILSTYQDLCGTSISV